MRAMRNYYLFKEIFFFVITLGLAGYALYKEEIIMTIGFILTAAIISSILRENMDLNFLLESFKKNAYTYRDLWLTEHDCNLLSWREKTKKPDNRSH
jgi:hypothetical protein